MGGKGWVVGGGKRCACRVWHVPGVRGVVGCGVRGVEHMGGCRGERRKGQG